MGNYKNKKQKLQMKFFALVALLGTAASMRIGNINGAQLVKAVHTQRVNNVFAKKRAQKLIKAKWENLTDAQEQEIEDWVVSELTEGEGTITKEEAHDAIVAFGEKHGFPPLPEEVWTELEAMFDKADLNDDGAIDLAELEAATSLALN